MQAFRNRFHRMSPEERNVLWIALGVSLLSGLFSYTIFSALLNSNTLRGYLANGAPFFMALIGLVSAGLIWQGRTRAGAITLIVGITLAMFMVPFVAEGYGLISGLVIFAVLLGVTSQIFKGNIISVIYVGGVTVALTLLIDAFWPFQRQGLDTDVATGNILGSILAIIIVLLIIRQYPIYPVRIKLTLALLAFTLITAGVITLYFQSITQSSIRENIGLQLKSSVNVASALIGNQLQAQVNQLTAISFDERLQDILIEANATYTGSTEKTQVEINQLDEKWIALVAANNRDDPLIVLVLNNQAVDGLHEYQEKFTANVEMLLTDQKGALVGATNLTSDFNQGDEDWWQSAYAQGRGQPYIGQAEYDESAEAFSFLISVPVRDRTTNEAIGVLRTTYLISEFDSFLGKPLGQTGKISLLFPGASPMMISGGALVESSTDNLNAAQETAGIEFAERVYEGKPSLVSSSQVNTTDEDPAIANLGWFILANQDRAEALAPLTRQNQTALLIVLAVVGVVAVGSVILSQFFTQPIISLTQAAQKISAGEINTQAKVETKDEIGTLAITFNQMTSQLRQTLEGLEQRVAERTRAIETSAIVGRRLSTVLDIEQLVKAVVTELQESFSYYHVQIYLLEKAANSENGEEIPSEGVLRLAGGTGSAGIEMIARGHQIPWGKGLVGRAAASGSVVFVPDTRNDPGWLPNPLLPETTAELAVPILIGDEVLGALDVQHNIQGGLSQQDVDLLQIIASQVAVTLRNARLFVAARRQAEHESQISTIIEQIQSTTSIEQALQIAAREIGQAVGRKPAIVRLVTTSENRSTASEEN